MRKWYDKMSGSHQPWFPFLISKSKVMVTIHTKNSIFSFSTWFLHTILSALHLIFSKVDQIVPCVEKQNCIDFGVTITIIYLKYSFPDIILWTRTWYWPSIVKSYSLVNQRTWIIFEFVGLIKFIRSKVKVTISQNTLN